MTITGAWVTRSPWRWAGTIQSDEPITGLALIDREGDVSWCRAKRSGALELPASLRLSEEPGMGAHVSWRIGDDDGLRSAWTQPAAPLDEVEIVQTGATGEPLLLAGIGGSPSLRIGAYLVVERDTASARLGLWHLRQGLRASSEAWTSALNYARTGKVEAEPLSR